MKLTEKTIIQGLKKRVNLSGNKVACIFDDIQYTWCELDLLSDLAAEKIANYGVKKVNMLVYWESIQWNGLYVIMQYIKSARWQSC